MDPFNADIARVAYEAVRAYSQTFGDHARPPWDSAAQWVHDTYLNAVERIRATLAISPKAVHQFWREDMERMGWRYGTVRAPENLEHPCLGAYEDMPAWIQVKALLIISVVRALAPEAALPPPVAVGPASAPEPEVMVAPFKRKSKKGDA